MKAMPPEERIGVTMSRMQAEQQLKNMREFTVATQELIAALAREDFAKAEASAQKLSYTEEKEKKARAMGGSVPAFVELAITFYKSGNAIGEAARKKDTRAVLGALETTLSHCNGCHAAYKQNIVEAK